jgi:hypothetical protein
MDEISTQEKHVNELLQIHQRNLSYLEKQIALYGGEMSAPVALLSQRDQILAEVRKLASPVESSLPADTLLARLEGLLGPDSVASLRALLQQARVGGTQPISINGDGNIVGNNNLVLVLKDDMVKEQVRKNSTVIIQPSRSLLPSIRVFISSTMKDLQPERDAVERALSSLDLETVRAETIGSQSVSPFEVSRTMAQECDIYLGLYGGRYGAIVPGDGRSITEIEYQTARERGKPILIYRKKDVVAEPQQAEFLKFVGDMLAGHTWREFVTADVPGKLIGWVQQDVRAEIERHSEWRENHLPAQERTLLASLGFSPGAITGLYHALARKSKPATRVITFSPTNRDTRESAALCEEEFRRLGVPYINHYLDARDIESDADAQEFKGVFYALLSQSLNSGEVFAGITGGRTVMGALMAIVAQTMPHERVTLCHFGAVSDIEDDGRITNLRRIKREDPDRYREVMAPPPGKGHLVQVPYVRIATSNAESD